MNKYHVESFLERGMPICNPDDHTRAKEFEVMPGGDFIYAAEQAGKVCCKHCARMMLSGLHDRLDVIQREIKVLEGV